MLPRLLRFAAPSTPAPPQALTALQPGLERLEYDPSQRGQGLPQAPAGLRLRRLRPGGGMLRRRHGIRRFLVPRVLLPPQGRSATLPSPTPAGGRHPDLVGYLRTLTPSGPRPQRPAPATDPASSARTPSILP